MRLVDCGEEAVREAMVREQNLSKVTGSQLFYIVLLFSLLLFAILYACVSRIGLNNTAAARQSPL